MLEFDLLNNLNAIKLKITLAGCITFAAFCFMH